MYKLIDKESSKKYLGTYVLSTQILPTKIKLQN